MKRRLWKRYGGLGGQRAIIGHGSSRNWRTDDCQAGIQMTTHTTRKTRRSAPNRRKTRLYRRVTGMQSSQKESRSFHQVHGILEERRSTTTIVSIVVRKSKGNGKHADMHSATGVVNMNGRSTESLPPILPQKGGKEYQKLANVLGRIKSIVPNVQKISGRLPRIPSTERRCLILGKRFPAAQNGKRSSPKHTKARNDLPKLVGKFLRQRWDMRFQKKPEENCLKHSRERNLAFT